jgi:copper chaperone CopZ
MKSNNIIKSLQVLLIGAAGFIILSSFMTDKAKGKFQTENFKVYGSCGMCEERIENALDVKGIRFADWDLEHQLLNVTFNTKKLTLQQVHQIVADAGHDTDLVKATDEVYKNIDDCCKYREGAKCGHEH